MARTDRAVVESTVEGGVEVEQLATPIVEEKPDKPKKTEEVKIAPPGPAVLAETPESRILRRQEDQALNDYLQQIRTTGPVQIHISRIRPTTHNGVNVGGHLDTTTELVTEEEIKEQFGGGVYMLKLMKRNAKGSWVFYTSTTIPIAGDPRIDSLPRARDANAPTGPAAPAGVDPMAKQMFEFMGKQVEEAKRDARGAAGHDAETMKMLLRPMELQVQMLQAQLDRKEQTISDLQRGPAKDPVESSLLQKLITDDTARVSAVREQLQSELRTVKENAREDEKRLRDQHDRDMKDAERRHERAMADMKATHERELANAKTTNEVMMSVKDGEIRRLAADLVELKGDYKELRAKKEQTISEKAKEILAVKEAIGGGDDDDEEKSTLEKVVEVGLSSPTVQQFASRFMTPAAPVAPVQPAQQQQQAQQPAKRQLRVGQKVRDRASGRVFQKMPDQSMREVTRAPAPVSQEVQIPPADLARAVQYMETGFRGNVPPATFAASARTAVPEALMKVLSDHLAANPERGVDEFLSKVAKLPGTSPLATQAGRNWAREVGKVLVGAS